MTVGNPAPVDGAVGREPAVVVDIRERSASGTPVGEFSGPEAASLAGISYRQLDYWARQEWVVPSRMADEGAQRRVYTAADVVRLAALGHLGRSRVGVATYGPAIGRLRLPDGAGFVVVWALHDERVELAGAKELRQVFTSPGRYVVFDPAPLLRAMRRRDGDGQAARPRRRTFTSGYKLGILAEYERAIEPGAKGALLRREGLHTSHLVAWRRWRDEQAATRGAPPRPAGRASSPYEASGWSPGPGSLAPAR